MNGVQNGKNGGGKGSDGDGCDDDAAQRKSAMSRIGTALESLPAEFAGKMLLHCSQDFGNDVLRDGQVSDRFRLTVASETPYLSNRYKDVMHDPTRPSLDSIWAGKEVESLEELQTLCDESIKLMGYWREHLGGSAVYVHSYHRKKRSHALRIVNGDSADAASRSKGNLRPPRREVLLPHDAATHFDVVQVGAEKKKLLKKKSHRKTVKP